MKSRFFIVFLLLSGSSQAQTPTLPWADTLLAEQLIKESGVLNRQDEHEAALAKTQQANAIYASLYDSQHPKTARSQLYVARELRETDQIPEAIFLYSQCLPVFETAKDTFRMFQCHHGLNLCLKKQFRLQEAWGHVRIAAQLLRPDSSRHRTQMADMHLNMADMHIMEKNYPAAVTALKSAQKVYLINGNKVSLGFTDYHFGNVYFGTHDFVRAKEHYIRSWGNLKNNLKPGHSYFADLQVKIGRCYQKTGESEVGLHWLIDAQNAYLKAGEESTNYIAFLQEFGQFYLDEHQYDAAVEQLEACLKAKETRYGPKSPRLLGILRFLGETCLKAGQYPRAETCLRRGIGITDDSLKGEYPLIWRFYGKLAESRFLQNDFPGSSLLCDTAFSVANIDLKHPENAVPQDFFRELCQLYGQTLLSLYRQQADIALLFKTERYFALAAETLHRELSDIEVNSSREIFYDLDYPVFTKWIEARMLLFEATHQIEHAEMAFQIAGQSKSFLLSESMRKSGALGYAGVPDSILQVERGLRESIAEAEKKLEMSGQQRNTQPDATQITANRDLPFWREKQEQLAQDLRANYPEYLRLRFLRNDIPTRELRSAWLASDQTLLMYSLGDAALNVYILSRDTFFATTLPLDFSLEQSIEAFRQSLTGYFATQDPDDALYDRQLETYATLAQLLYQKLIQPVAAFLSNRVVIIPEGTLCYLPFEALLTGPPADLGNFRKYPFWLRKKAVSYGLSPIFLTDIAAKPNLKPEKNWLGIAPFAEQPGHRGKGGPVVRQELFLPLPCSGKEVRDIAARWQGDCWIGTAAAPERFHREAARYRILHLATHSRADDRLGHYAYIAVSNPGAPLLAKDLYQFSLAADMVVLSACETGGGKLLRGEGIMGMVRAFTFAGAKSVVASQWVASDQSTAHLMSGFYQNLKNKMPKDIALQKARLEMIDHSPTESHPFFWTGFRVYGNIAAMGND